MWDQAVKMFITCIFRKWKGTCSAKKSGTQQCYLLTLAPWKSTKPARFDHIEEVQRPWQQGWCHRSVEATGRVRGRKTQ
jgi:hypothetical protein